MTAQIGEQLILDGKLESMTFCPPLPKHHPRIVTVNDEEAQKSDPWVFSTGCWRRYVGTWEIKDGRFYLVGLEGRFRLIGADPLRADWFSGVLRIPRGKMLEYVHMGFGSVFQKEVHIKVRRGIVVGSRVIDNRGKSHNERKLTWQNLPGFENRFAGDRASKDKFQPYVPGPPCSDKLQAESGKPKSWWQFWRKK